MRRLAAVAVAALLCATVSCGGGAIPRPDDSAVARVRPRWPDTTRAQLEQGRDLYVARCGGCHPLHRPGELDAARWSIVVGEMAERARLDVAQRDLVLRYLTALSAP
ncbi:MAG TPA: hypothetical protein VMZ28_18890 [Kofleriaceae bacterium]|nr:hypothetical protein [Kofleriaceae bacterium]